MQKNYPLFNVWVTGCIGLLLLVSAPALAQEQRTVTGTVTDEANTLLPGVNVIIENTTTGTITDLDGRYNLQVPSGPVTLVFSYVGYENVKVNVGSRSSIDISLSSNVSTLSEIVVVGYGTQEKRDVTAAISSIGKEAIGQTPLANPVESMKGRVSGVDILQNGGRPGQAPSITIRGRRSLTASNDPLFVVDGVPMTSGTIAVGKRDNTDPNNIPEPIGSGAISDFNPQDIESIEILKDAAATAIYGSRGANGVVLVTTKRGKAGKTVFAYDGYIGVTSAIKTVDMMNGEEFADLKRESRRRDTDGNTGRQAWGAPGSTIPADEVVFEDPAELESIATGRSTDYMDLVLGNGSQTNHQLSASGGNEKTRFNTSLGYFNEQGIISNQDYQRVTGRLNLDHQISSIFKFGFSSFVSTSTQNWGSDATFEEALNNNPLGQPYNEDGTPKFLPIADGIRTNPLNELVDGAYIDERKFTRIFSSVYVEANILKGLNYKILFGPDIRFYRRGVFQGRYTNARRGADPAAELENTKDFGYTLENLLTYDKSFGTKHDLKLTFLQSVQEQTLEYMNTRVVNLPVESVLWYNLASAGTLERVRSGLDEWQLASFMGRINYSFAGKYLFQFSYRTDGSSRLAPGNKWAPFPGVSVGWRISDEPFMGGVEKWLSGLKLRGSYGAVGNTSVDPYQTFDRLVRTVYDWNDANAVGYRLNDLKNENLTWEISRTVDLGIDYEFFQGRIYGSLDVYKTRTEDLLLERKLPFTSGYEEILQNVGSTETQGIEFSLGSTIINSANGFKWSVDFNISSYDEKITSLALKDEKGNPVDDIGNRWFIGHPTRVFFDYKKIGIWQANEAGLANEMDKAYPGDIKVADIKKDGVITPDDRTILGSDIPDYFGGITNRIDFKGFDFSFFFYFRQGHMIESRFNSDQTTMQGRYNNLDVDYWTIDNPTNSYPRPNINQEHPIKYETLRYFDGSYVKLRNVTLGYNFPRNLTEVLRMTSLRIYASAQNPWFSAKFDTFDPESANELTAGDVPPSKLFLIGINAKF